MEGFEDFHRYTLFIGYYTVCCMAHIVSYWLMVSYQTALHFKTGVWQAGVLRVFQYPQLSGLYNSNHRWIKLLS